jgi:hypothetical protein
MAGSPGTGRACERRQADEVREGRGHRVGHRRQGAGRRRALRQLGDRSGRTRRSCVSVAGSVGHPAVALRLQPRRTFERFASPSGWSLLSAERVGRGRTGLASFAGSTPVKKESEVMSTQIPTGVNWADAMQPLEARRSRERVAVVAFEPTVRRQPRAADLSARRAGGRQQRNWWVLVGLND